MSTIISAKNISFAYNKNQAVLKNISLDVHAGEFLALIGPNGGGKSTLLKLLLGILPLQEGSVELLGQPLKDFKDWCCIGYVSQKATNFDQRFPATVKEIVGMGRIKLRGPFKALTIEDKKMVERALHDVDMLEYKDRPLHELSGGQQQRVFIARALVTYPALLALDEPTVGVDINSQKQFYALLQKLCKKKGLAIILVSHDINVVANEASNFACLNQSLVYHGTPEDFKMSHMIAHNH